MCQIGQAVALPDDKNYRIRVTVGGAYIEFDPLPLAQKGTYKRYKRQEETLELPYVDVEDMGHVVFQLMDESNNLVAYYLHDVKDFTTEAIEAASPEDPKFGPKQIWANFLPDNAVKKIKQPHKAGIFSFRMHITMDDDEKFFKQYKVWKKRPPMRANAIKIRAYIY